VQQTLRGPDFSFSAVSVQGSDVLANQINSPSGDAYQLSGFTIKRMECPTAARSLWQLLRQQRWNTLTLLMPSPIL
jgi:hypothetical protein